jgi:hypothetical protein
MAEYYTLFCEKLEIRTSEEYEWLKRVYAWTPEEDGGINLEDMEAEIERVKEELGFDLSYEDFDTFPEHQYELTSESLRVYSEEDLSTGTVSRIIQGFLRKFRPDECFSITWAFTCSKTWVGEFAGGAVFITADKIEDHHVRNFVMQKEMEHEKRIAAKKKAI